MILNCAGEEVKPLTVLQVIENEIIAHEQEINAQYWRFTRSKSSKTKPPDGELYKQLRILKGQKRMIERSEK